VRNEAAGFLTPQKVRPSPDRCSMLRLLASCILPCLAVRSCAAYDSGVEYEMSETVRWQDGKMRRAIEMKGEARCSARRRLLGRPSFNSFVSIAWHG
jgi:hypothetical protein